MPDDEALPRQAARVGPLAKAIAVPLLRSGGRATDRPPVRRSLRAAFRLGRA
ncbi:MAG: hypothetical protein M3203_03125 [Actinomycetota bacterium]|nr:hypothetical protein [Actinomycetota bacterium]